MSRVLALRPLALVLALAACTGAQAHRPWLLPSGTLVDGKEPVVSVDSALSEDLFEFDTVAYQLDAVVVTAPDGSASAGEAPVATKRHLSFDVRLAQKGTYRIAGVSDTVMASWKAGGETKRWRGPAAAQAREVPADAADLQVSHTLTRLETFVSNDTAGLPAASAAGVGIELQPLTPPTDLSTGDTSRLRVLLDGKPYANADVTVIRGGNRYRYKLGELALKTNADGVVEVRWPEAGRYWLGVNHGGRGGPGEGGPGGPAPMAGGDAPKGPANGGPAPGRRESYTATFEVLPR